MDKALAEKDTKISNLSVRLTKALEFNEKLKRTLTEKEGLLSDVSFQ